MKQIGRSSSGDEIGTIGWTSASEGIFSELFWRAGGVGWCRN